MKFLILNEGNSVGNTKNVFTADQVIDMLSSQLGNQIALAGYTPEISGNISLAKSFEIPHLIGDINMLKQIIPSARHYVNLNTIQTPSGNHEVQLGVRISKDHIIDALKAIGKDDLVNKINWTTSEVDLAYAIGTIPGYRSKLVNWLLETVKLTDDEFAKYTKAVIQNMGGMAKIGTLLGVQIGSIDTATNSITI